MPLMYSRDLLLPCVSMLISIGRLYATPNYRRNLVPVFFMYVLSLYALLKVVA